MLAAWGALALLTLVHLAAQLAGASTLADASQWFLMPLLAACLWLATRRRDGGRRDGDGPGRRSRLVRLTLVALGFSWLGDTGIGVRQEDMGKLFQEFSQVDASASRRVQGSGLGLALSKRLVELHGGQIGCESVYTKGSTFWFILPTEGPVRRPGVKVAE